MAPIDAVQPAGRDQPQAVSGFNPYQQDAYLAALQAKGGETTNKGTAADKTSDAPSEPLTPDAVRS